MRGITATEAAVILGVNPWKTPFALWSEKVGLAEPDDLSNNEAVRWGHRLQGPIIAAYREERPETEVEAVPEWVMERTIERPWMLATLDGRQYVEGKGPGVLEIKTAGAQKTADWADGEIPLVYQIQVQHQLAVTGLDWGTIAVLIGGQKFLWQDVERNQPFIDAMVLREEAFLELIRTETPPEVDGSDATGDALKKLYPEDTGEVIAMPSEATEWDERLVEVKAELKTLEGEKNLLENRLKAALGEAAEGVLANGVAYTWKLQTNRYPAKEASEVSFRVLRRKKGAR
jgi:putative phage-type endonuclease